MTLEPARGLAAWNAWAQAKTWRATRVAAELVQSRASSTTIGTEPCSVDEPTHHSSLRGQVKARLSANTRCN